MTTPHTLLGFPVIETDAIPDDVIVIGKPVRAVKVKLEIDRTGETVQYILRIVKEQDDDTTRHPA